MKGTNVNNFDKKAVLLRVGISETQKKEAKKLAKSKGYSFQGWLGFLVKKELKNADLQKNEIDYS